ncbi:hypothetical protein HORIV_54490 [Vreelandella olivaria]|uniref:Uncharacterized protein n=1 Tax=Vreelandella olivaria TaxID=390919 RepID=A0ABN5X2F0_9GAMM|nr:hypothetical protein HORIV_54490 [Halomonas olivaria]
METFGLDHHFSQRIALGPLTGRARNAPLNFGTAYIQQLVVLHAGRAGGFAVKAGQAAVKVQARLVGDLVVIVLALQQLLHEIDTPTGPSRSSPNSW